MGDGGAYFIGFMLAELAVLLIARNPDAQSTLPYLLRLPLAKIDPSLAGAASLVYSTFLDGNVYSLGLGIAVDGLGNALVTGRTGSTSRASTCPR